MGSSGTSSGGLGVPGVSSGLRPIAIRWLMLEPDSQPAQMSTFPDRRLAGSPEPGVISIASLWSSARRESDVTIGTSSSISDRREPSPRLDGSACPTARRNPDREPTPTRSASAASDGSAEIACTHWSLMKSARTSRRCVAATEAAPSVSVHRSRARPFRTTSPCGPSGRWPSIVMVRRTDRVWRDGVAVAGP